MGRAVVRVRLWNGQSRTVVWIGLRQKQGCDQGRGVIRAVTGIAFPGIVECVQDWNMDWNICLINEECRKHKHACCPNLVATSETNLHSQSLTLIQAIVGNFSPIPVSALQDSGHNVAPSVLISGLANGSCEAQIAFTNEQSA